MQATGPQFVTTENSMAVVQASRGFLKPASDDLLSEPAIVARLATATLGVRVRESIGMALAERLRSDSGSYRACCAGI